MEPKYTLFSYSTDSEIGENCSIGQNVNIGNNVKIGNFVKIQNNVSVYEGVELEDYVFCGPSMVFTNVASDQNFLNVKQIYSKTLVKKSASIGANATLFVTIGKYALIGSGTVVTKDIPDYSLSLATRRIIGKVDKKEIDYNQ